jgi:hypothetical protein
MADLDEFLKPEVTRDAGDFFGELQTIWKIPGTMFVPPNGEKRFDEFVTNDKATADKAQQILDAGFTFTWEILRLVGQAAYYITGKCQWAADEEPEEEDAAIAVTGPGKQSIEAFNRMVLDFDLSKVEDGVYRRWK